MNRRIACIISVLVMVAPAAADGHDGSIDGTSSSYQDRSGDAPQGLDIRSVTWSVQNAYVSVTLDSDLMADAGLTAILFVGSEGASEPDQAYIMHHGPSGDRILHGTDGETTVMTVDSQDRQVTFQLDHVPDSSCAFAVARTVTYHDEGQQVEDVVGWTGPAIEDAWDIGRACSAGQSLDGVASIGNEAVDTPGPGLLAITAAIAGLAWAARRRHQ